MSAKDIADWTDEEINLFLVRNVMKRKPVKPSEYMAKLKGKNADYWRERLSNYLNVDRWVLVENDKPLKTHHYFTDPLPDIVKDKNYTFQILEIFVGTFGGEWSLTYVADFNDRYSFELRQQFVNFTAASERMERAICETICEAILENSKLGVEGYKAEKQ